MQGRSILIFLAALGLGCAAVMAVQAENPSHPMLPIAEGPAAVFPRHIGGSGTVEPNTNVVAVGTPVAGIVQSVFVAVGDKVKAGDPLFSIDDRAAQADLAVRRADLAKARAAIEETRASLRDYEVQYGLVRDLADRRAVSIEEVEKRRNAELIARTRVASARAGLAAAEAEATVAAAALERLTVRAPMAGEVLQVNLRAGEYAATGPLAIPPLRLGNLDPLHIRVDIDETEAWRFRPATRAIAALRGNRGICADLAFVRVEPFLAPRAAASGEDGRSGSRVLQVLFAVGRDALPVFVGQQVDVFIETTESPALPVSAALPARGRRS